MKMQLPYLSSLAALIIIISFVACHKEKASIADRRGQPPQVSPIDDREYYYGILWKKDSSGYEMNLDLGRLTDTTIRRGVTVYVAIYSDWSPFYRLPLTLSDPFLSDTVNFTYTLTPGHVKVFAKTPLNIDWPSDISVAYY
jgi:hypothetical protein